MRKALLIVNPTAGKMSGKTALFDIISEFSAHHILVTTAITNKRGDATEYAQKGDESREYDFIVCCGGDGTLNETLNGLIKSGGNTPLSYIPAGSTNDFAKSMNIPLEITAAARKIANNSEEIFLDIGSFCKNKIFSYIASFGAFTSTSYSVPQNMKNSLGHFAYVLGGIMDVASIKPYHVTVNTSDKEFEGDYIFCAVSNSSSLGGVIKLNAEDVSMVDGLFEVLAIKNPKNPNELHKILWGIINGDFSDKEIFEYFKTDKITFNMPENVNWSLDGEYEEGKQVVEIENLHGKIRFLK
ncbi:MAG: diacylglycerol kinase family lipid kinase [Clostridia bacterium]|nr:diacylglycerol kinase family lipid kinase [Clostridia bacterium]